jgi:hypothetical protein
VRHGRPSKQRLWLGPGRYRGRRGHAVTNCDAESYATSNGYAFSVRASGIADADGDGNCDCDCDNNGYRHSYSYSYDHGNRLSNRNRYIDAKR